MILPRNSLGRVRAAAVSTDLKWLAVSERTRGAVWDLTKGERISYVRGFRGAHFAEDGSFYADFPKLDATERTIARLDLARREVVQGAELKEVRASQHGAFVLVTKPAKPEGGFAEDVIVEVRDARSLKALWSKPFPDEAPAVWVDAETGTAIMAWSISSEAMKSEVKADAALRQRLAMMGEKEGDYLLHVLDLRTGAMRGRLLIETGKGSFRIKNASAAGDRVVISDTENRVLVYSLASGDERGKVFGGRATITKAGDLFCVENESGALSVYSTTTMEKHDQFNFSSPVALAHFTDDGKRLFVLTANQTAYVLDVSSAAR